ncbi:MAG: ArsR family transcriptional regulator [Clostridiaceae bacterium]|nr:ArsR family transcriptional regulator [Clostridiaceae bacterium]
MKLNISHKHLPVYEALASEVRLNIINLLAKKPMNIKELANQLGLSSAILTMHVRKLENAQIIKSERIQVNRAISKVCSLAVDKIEIDFPVKDENALNIHEFSLPVGHYTDFEVEPTCGLATAEKIIGYFDDPRCFLDPERVDAKILWFSKGYVEYKVPNYLLPDQTPKALEISMELGSEAPGVNENWPSDIAFYLNGIKIGQWTSPGDFGGTRGKFTPEWWSLGVNQYGLLKVLKIDDTGSYMDGQRISNITLDSLNIRKKQWTFRIEVDEKGKHQGGVTVFGTNFGNYNQDIIFKLFYT